MCVRVVLQEAIEVDPAPRARRAACALRWVLVLPCMALSAPFLPAFLLHRVMFFILSPPRRIFKDLFRGGIFLVQNARGGMGWGGDWRGVGCKPAWMRRGRGVKPAFGACARPASVTATAPTWPGC